MDSCGLYVAQDSAPSSNIYLGHRLFYLNFGADIEVAVLPHLVITHLVIRQPVDHAMSHGDFLVNSGILCDGRSKLCDLFYIFKSFVINCEIAGITGLSHCHCLHNTNRQIKFSI